MRLIDADTFINKYCKANCAKYRCRDNFDKCQPILELEIEPTAYDVNKVVEQLHNLKKYFNPYDSYYEEANYRATEFDNSVTNKVIDDVIKIVKAGGENEI